MMFGLDTGVKKKSKVINYVVFVPITSPGSINTNSIPTKNYSSISIPAYYCCTDEGV